MSAWQVSPNHIGAMLRFYLFDCTAYERRAWRDVPDLDDAPALAALLADACFKSVSYRYPGDVATNSLPGPEAFGNCPVEVDTRNLGIYRKLSPVEAIKAVHCYEYQSCEHPEWDGSQAHDLCRQILSTAIGRLPGYETADWGIDDPAPSPASA